MTVFENSFGTSSGMPPRPGRVETVPYGMRGVTERMRTSMRIARHRACDGDRVRSADVRS